MIRADQFARIALRIARATKLLMNYDAFAAFDSKLWNDLSYADAVLEL